MTSRTLLVCCGVAALITGGGSVWYLTRSLPAETVVMRSPEEIRRQWQEGVREVVRRYPNEVSAIQARDELLGFTVPAEHRSVHLGLVLALEAAIQQRTDASQRWIQATEAFQGL